MTERRLISHSEVDTLGQCEYKHKYAHEYKLEARTHSDNLTLGTTGHHFMEHFLKAIKAGETTATAQEMAMNATIGMDKANDAMALTLKWVKEVWPTLDWKIMGVEMEYRVAISDTLVYPFKADVLVETEGKIAVVDHKFIYDPYPRSVIEILPQIPRYIAGLRAHDIPVDFGIYNMFRTRKTSKDVLTQVATYPSNARVIQSFKEQIEGMERIEKGIPFRVRTANKINCANCQFADLCTAELNGEDTELMKEMFFMPNTYGYKDNE